MKNNITAINQETNERVSTDVQTVNEVLHKINGASILPGQNQIRLTESTYTALLCRIQDRELDAQD